jgi:dTDP-glucose pyrophosphorylase
MPIDADQLTCSERGYVIFLARPAPGEKFEEVARFKSSNIARVVEKPEAPKPNPKKSKTVRKMDKELK